MCCLLTCCGWMIDLVQRAWVFAMSFCIVSAVCCVMITASMSGVALGYNYSLSEFIELKETNVSVYLKRGVFDDDVVDELDWRRGGNMPGAAGRRSNEESESSDTEFPYNGRRANDESIFATQTINKPNDLYGPDEDQHRFEGSLRKLTGKPLYGTKTPTMNPELLNIMSAYPQAEEVLTKNLQALMNRRKMQDLLDININSQTGPGVVNNGNKGDIPLNVYSTTVGDQSQQLQAIKNLLDERKNSVNRFQAFRSTRKQTTLEMPASFIPKIYHEMNIPERRVMNDEHPVRSTLSSQGSQDLNFNSMEDAFGELMKKPIKWYKQKLPKISESLYNKFPEQRAPVTITPETTTRTKINRDDLKLLTKDVFRKAMKDSYAEQAQSKYDQTDWKIFNEQQKDYNEEDVRGVPVRKKRAKRSIHPRDDITLRTNQIENEDGKYINFGMGLFKKIMMASIT